MLALAQYYSSEFGFTYFLRVGEFALAEKPWSQDLETNIYVHERTWGYDGQYYAQLALDPLMQNGDLDESVDNLPYRARRILLPALAHVIGFGRPTGVLNIFAFLNIVSWAALALLLLRWFPPTSINHTVRWLGVMFSTGMCSSVSMALVDGPCLLFLALALRWIEERRPKLAAFSLALGGLVKETTLLGIGLLAPVNWRIFSHWPRAILAGIVTILPLGIWVIFIFHRFSDQTNQGAGAGNFSLPLVAMGQKLQELTVELASGGLPWATWGISMACLMSVFVQAVFVITRWRWTQPAWRLTVSFALLAFVIGPGNWNGYPGGASRSLLPLLLGFNLLVPRGRRWIPILILGNCSAFFSPLLFLPVPEPIGKIRVQIPAETESRRSSGLATVDFPLPWHGLEEFEDQRWRWSNGPSDIIVHNPFDTAVVASIDGEWAAKDERIARLMQNHTVLWEQTLSIQPKKWSVTGIVLPPGKSVLTIESNAFPTVAGRHDLRKIDVRLYRLSFDCQLAPASTPPTLP